MYENILKKVGIEGETESDKFRSLIEFMYDYVDVNPPPIQVERKVEGNQVDQSRLDVLDLMMRSIRDHEVRLDRVASRLEEALGSSISGDELQSLPESGVKPRR